VCPKNNAAAWSSFCSQSETNRLNGFSRPDHFTPAPSGRRSPIG
jgi:hypothetical protein